jgi:hypothetical protein
MPKKTKKKEFYCENLPGQGVGIPISLATCAGTVKGTDSTCRLILIYREQEWCFPGGLGQYLADFIPFTDDPVPLHIYNFNKVEVAAGNLNIGNIMQQVQCFLAVHRSNILRILFPYSFATPEHKRT